MYQGGQAKSVAPVFLGPSTAIHFTNSANAVKYQIFHQGKLHLVNSMVLWRKIMKQETHQNYREKIIRVLLYIQKNLDEPISLDQLSELAFLSPYHFHRVFRGMVGEAVKEHIRRLRLERSAQHLTGTDRPIIRIALDAGYETHESFSRAFRDMFGKSPSQYRKEKKPFFSNSVPNRVHYDPEQNFNSFVPNDTGGAIMDVEVINFQPIRVAFARHVGPYQDCGFAWEKICGWAGPKGLLKPDTRFIGICHDDPHVTPQEKIRYDACITVDEAIQPEGEIGIQEIEGGRHAVGVHKGPFEGLSEFYARLCGEWISKHEFELKFAPSVEVYLNDPDKTPPEELLIEIRVPLA